MYKKFKLKQHKRKLSRMYGKKCVQHFENNLEIFVKAKDSRLKRRKLERATIERIYMKYIIKYDPVCELSQMFRLHISVCIL